MRAAGIPVAEGWKVKYGGLKVSEAKRLPELDEENRQLEAPGHRVDAGNRVLKAVLSRKSWVPRRSDDVAHESGRKRSERFHSWNLR